MREPVMDLGMSKRVRPLVQAVSEMVRERIIPLEHEFEAEIGKAAGGRFAFTPRQEEILETLKTESRAQGLWNFWLTHSDQGYGLNTVEYAYLAEEMGWSNLAPEAFNCSAPDTGNMEVIERCGSAAQKAQWLTPLLNGEIRSAYLMTEPGVASSDATNIELSAVQDGDDFILNGEKWWASGAGDPRCRVYLLMALTAPEGRERYARHTQFLVPADTPGIEVLRPMEVFGQDDAPHGHMHIRFTDVRVPASAVLLGEGRGFEISQRRLGPGRIHHCMRAIGQAERALELLCKRSVERVAFGKPLARLGQNPDIIAELRMGIEQARLLCLRAAWEIDQGDPKAAQPWISQVKVIAPRIALQAIDEAIQMHGGMGVSQDTPLARLYTSVRTLRLADGPDAVHRMVVARDEMRRKGLTNR